MFIFLLANSKYPEAGCKLLAEFNAVGFESSVPYLDAGSGSSLEPTPIPIGVWGKLLERFFKVNKKPAEPDASATGYSSPSSRLRFFWERVYPCPTILKGQYRQGTFNEKADWDEKKNQEWVGENESQEKKVEPDIALDSNVDFSGYSPSPEPGASSSSGSSRLPNLSESSGLWSSNKPTPPGALVVRNVKKVRKSWRECEDAANHNERAYIQQLEYQAEQNNERKAAWALIQEKNLTLGIDNIRNQWSLILAKHGVNQETYMDSHNPALLTELTEFYRVTFDQVRKYKVDMQVSAITDTNLDPVLLLPSASKKSASLGAVGVFTKNIEEAEKWLLKEKQRINMILPKLQAGLSKIVVEAEQNAEAPAVPQTALSVVVSSAPQQSAAVSAAIGLSNEFQKRLDHEEKKPAEVSTSEVDYEGISRMYETPPEQNVAAPEAPVIPLLPAAANVNVLPLQPQAPQNVAAPVVAQNQNVSVKQRALDYEENLKRIRNN